MSEASPDRDPAAPGPAGSEPIHPRPPTPAAPRQGDKPHSDLPSRLLTAAFLVPGISYVIVQGGLLYLATVIALILLAQTEFYRLIEDKGARPLKAFGLSAGAALPVVAYLGTEYHMTVLLTATLLVLLVAQLGKATITEALASVSGTYFGVVYVGWLLSYAIVLRNFHSAALSNSGPAGIEAVGIVPGAGIFFMFFTLFCVVWCDVGAYFGGRAWGRRKLARKISPGKTVEGAVTGVLTGTLAGLVCKIGFDVFWPELSQSLSVRAVLIFGFVLSIAGMVGDLVESLLKRDASVKDTGALLPGMGGILDRIDAPLLGIPIMYYGLLLYLLVKAG